MSGYQGYPQGQWPGGYDAGRAQAPGNPPDGWYSEMSMADSAPMSRVMPGGGETYKRPAQYSGEDFSGVPNAKRSRSETGGLPVRGQGQEADWRIGTIDVADRSRTLFVFNLMPNTTASDLFEYFVKFGDLMKFDVFNNNEGKCTGIVQYVREEAAKAAQRLRPQFIHKKQVIISYDRQFDSNIIKSLERHKLYVSNIPLNVSEEDLCEYFSQWGNISFCDVPEKAKRTRNARFVFISYTNFEDAVKCLNTTHNYGETVINVHVAAKCRALRGVVKEVRNNGDVDGHQETNKLFVSNVPAEVHIDELTEHFSMWGKLYFCKVIGNVTQNNNYGFVSYQEQEDALTALIMPHTLRNQRMFVCVANKKGGPLLEASKDPNIMSAIEQKVQNCFVYVLNLSALTTNDELYEHFKKYGGLAGCMVKPSGNRLFAFVAYVKEDAAARCYNDVHFLNNMKLKVCWSDLTKWGVKGTKALQRSEALAAESSSPARPAIPPRCTSPPRHVGPTNPPRHAGPANPPRHAGPANPPRHTGPANPPRYAGPANPPRHAGPAYPPRYAGPANPPRHAGPANPPRHAGPANPLRQAGPANPPRHAGPANPPRYAGPANPPRHAGPANPPRHAGPANPPRYAGPANPPRHAGPANPPRHTGPANPPRHAGPANPSRYAGPANPPGPAGPTRDVGFARPAYPVPQNADPSDRKLNISGLAAQTRGYKLMCYFSRWGKVEDFEVVKDVRLRPTGCAYVIFENQDDAEKAVSDKPHVIDDKEVKVTFANPRKVPPNRKLSVSGLAVHTRDYKLLWYFSKWGGVEDVELVRDVKLRPTGCAFVIFETQGDAEKAVSDKQHVIDGEAVEVTFAKSLKNLPSETFPSWREQRPHETVQQQRLPESIKSLDQGYNPPEAREPRRLLEDAQPRRLLEDAQPRRLLEDAQPRRLREDAQPRRLLEDAQPRRLLEDAQPRRLLEDAQPRRLLKDAQPRRLLKDAQPGRLREDAQPRRLLKDAQPQRLLEDAQPQRLLEDAQPRRLLKDAQPRRLPEVYQLGRQSTPDPLTSRLTQVESVPDVPLVTEYECNVSGCLFKGKSEQFERHWTKIHEAKVLYLICSFCTMGCVDADDLREHLDFFHGVEDRRELSTFLLGARQQERDNIHFVMPGNVTRETCMKVTKPPQKKDDKGVHNCTECTFTGTVNELIDHWDKNHLSVLNFLRCPKCPKTFMKKGFLLFHIKTKHQNTEIRTEEEPDNVEDNFEESQNFSLGSSHAYHELPRSETDISDIGSRSAGNRSMQTIAGASLSAPLQSDQSLPRPQLPILPYQQPTPPTPPPASPVPTQQAVNLHGQVTPFYPSTASVPKPVPPLLTPPPLPPPVLRPAPQAAVGSQSYPPAYPQLPVLVTLNTSTQQPVVVASRPAVSTQSYIVPPVSYSQASFQHQVRAQSQQACVVASSHTQVVASVAPSVVPPPQAGAPLQTLPLTGQVITQSASAQPPVFVMEQQPVASVAPSVVPPTSPQAGAPLQPPLTGQVITQSASAQPPEFVMEQQPVASVAPSVVPPTSPQDGAPLQLPLTGQVIAQSATAQPPEFVMEQPPVASVAPSVVPPTSQAGAPLQLPLTGQVIAQSVSAQPPELVMEQPPVASVAPSVVPPTSPQAGAPLQPPLTGQVIAQSATAQPPEFVMEQPPVGSVAPSVVPPTSPQAGAPLQPPLTGQVIAQSVSAQRPEFVVELPPVASQSVVMPDFDLGNIKTQEKEKSRSEQEIVTKMKANDELKRSVQPGSILALRPEWTKTLKIAHRKNSPLDKNTSEKKSSFTTEVKFIPKFDSTHPECIQKFLLWSHIMMERLEDVNNKVRRRLKADEGQDDVAEGDDDEDPEEMLELSSDEETGGWKSTAVKGTLSQAHEDMKARAQTVAEKVVADYRSTNRYTNVASNKGQSGKGVGKQRLVDQKVLGQLFHKSAGMIKCQSKRANVDADLVRQGISWVKQDIRRMLERNKMMKSETDEESEKASFSAKSDERSQSFQPRKDKGEGSKMGRRDNSDLSRKERQQRTDNRGWSSEDLQQRTDNSDQSRKERQQRTENRPKSRDKCQHGTDNRGRASEDLQQRTGKGDRSRKERQQRTDNCGLSRDKHQHRTENRGRTREEFPDTRDWNVENEEHVEVYMDEYVNKDEEYDLSYLDEDGDHVMDDGFVMGEGGHVEMEESEEEYLEYRDDDRTSFSSSGNSSVRMRRNEDRRSQSFEDQMSRESVIVEDDEYFDEGKECFVEEENEGFIQSERVVEVVNSNEHKGAFDTAWSESAQQDGRILPGQGSSLGRESRRLDRDRGFSNQHDNFKTDKSVTRGSQGRGSRAHSKSFSADESVRRSGKERNRGREIPKHTEHFSKDDSVKRDRKDFVDEGTTKSQKMRSKQIDDRDYHRNLRNRSWGDKASSSETKSQYLKKEGVDTKTEDQLSSGNKNERKGGDNTEGNKGNMFEWELDDISEGVLSGDGSLCEFDMDDVDMDDVDMGDFVVLDDADVDDFVVVDDIDMGDFVVMDEV